MPRLAIAIFVAIVATLGGWSGFGGSWERWAPATCRPDHCFCEAIGGGAVAQPANAWSSLAFVLVGLIVAHAGTAAWRRLYGYALVAIGLGSYFYHASLSFAGQVCDMSGMYLLVTFALAYGLARRRGRVLSMRGYVLLNLVLLGFQVALPDARRYVFAALVIGVVWLELRAGVVERKWLWRAAGMMAVGFGFWVVDQTHLVCSPGSLVQGHAIWHLMGAGAGACLYRYYQSYGAAV